MRKLNCFWSDLFCLIRHVSLWCSQENYGTAPTIHLKNYAYGLVLLWSDTGQFYLSYRVTTIILQGYCKWRVGEPSYLRWTAAFSHVSHIEGLAQDCSNSIANSLELLQSCTKLLICDIPYIKEHSPSWYLVITEIYSMSGIYSRVPL